MSWFFGGGSGDKDSNSSSQSSSITPTYDTHNTFEHDTASFAAPSSAGFSSSNSFEQSLLQEQQKALVQSVMFRLTEMSFEACVTKPGTSLSSSEKSCINAVTTKYMETSEFIVGAMGAGQH